jgi:ribonuclease P protein subunit RPR2
MVIKKSEAIREIAHERIKILHKLAKIESSPELSRKYIKLAREISRHYKVKIENDIKRQICKKCNSVLIPGKSVSIRLASSKRYVVYKCLNCGAEQHIHY